MLCCLACLMASKGTYGINNLRKKGSSSINSSQYSIILNDTSPALLCFVRLYAWSTLIVTGLDCFRCWVHFEWYIMSFWCRLNIYHGCMSPEGVLWIMMVPEQILFFCRECVNKYHWAIPFVSRVFISINASSFKAGGAILSAAFLKVRLKLIQIEYQLIHHN